MVRTFFKYFLISLIVLSLSYIVIKMLPERTAAIILFLASLGIGVLGMVFGKNDKKHSNH